VGLFALLLVGLASRSSGALSGSYRCTINVLYASNQFAILKQFNPTSHVQNIKRVRVYNSSGVLIVDTGSITVPVPPNGNTYSTFVGSGGTDYQVVVNWNQSVDGPAPLARVEEWFYSSTVGDFTSVSSRPCP
jgi:hypothetical protein